ncbi:hypothetical protein ABBQ32_005793 [Trebouxia sp. C0010 RCD-2024]
MVLIYGNLTECKVCLDSDFYDLWRSCGDCNITYLEPECEMTCEFCLAGEGEDTANVPAPRANQQVAIPAAGCSVVRRDFQLKCDPQSVGRCGVLPAPSRSGIGCQPCPTSSFVNDCEGCKVLGCQASCDSCLSGDTRSGTMPTPLTIPAGGCQVYNDNAKLICIPGSEASCPLVAVPSRATPLTDWKIGVAVGGSVLGLLLIATLAIVFWRRRNRLRHNKNTWSARTTSTELGKAPEQLVHASIIPSNDIQLCKRPNGEDWLLGMGAFGMVYKAKMGDVDVAVKTIHRQHVSPHLTAQQALQAIAKELTILEMIPFDKRIVRLYGSCSLDSNILLVLEFMEGGDLHNALQELSTAPQLSWYINGANVALDVIKGLRFLHSHNIVHRDIKSGNILLSKDCDSAKICDVGLARIMSNTSITSSSHNVMTTFPYAAPEILLCERSNHRADIFSFGVLLWELITQETPQRGNLRDLQVPQECPQVISDVVEACTSQLPMDRPTTQQIIYVIESSMTDTEEETSCVVGLL